METDSIYLGIDFGTTNSSIAYIYADPRHERSQSIPVKEMPIMLDEENGLTVSRMPTLLSTRFDDQRSSKLAKGWEVSRLLGLKKKLPLVRKGQQLFESVKSDLGSKKIYVNSASEECNTPKKAASKILESLLEQATKQLRFDLDRAKVVITVPASLNAAARKETLEAAVEAGLNENLIELIDEPVAALLHLLNEQDAAAVLSPNEPRNILIFDYGGGTLDLCLMKCAYNLDAPTGVAVENLAISKYSRNGGNDVDRAIMRSVVWPQIEKQIDESKESLPADLRRAIDDTLTSSLARKLKERICSKITKELSEKEGYKSIRNDLNETVETEAKFTEDRLPKPITGKFKITKAQFDSVMNPIFDGALESDAATERLIAKIFGEDYINGNSLVTSILECLKKANLKNEDLHALVLHGGSCRNPYVLNRLEELLPEEGGNLFKNAVIARTPNFDTSVACGAALACYWKHARGIELVKPITAEEIGIITLGGSPESLLPSGTSLPFPEEGVHEHPTVFYVPENGQKELIVPFYCGYSFEKPKQSGIIKLPLPENVKSGAEVRLKLHIDEDKIMHWWYSIAGDQFQVAMPIEDPWTAGELNANNMRLIEHRELMENTFFDSEFIPDHMQIKEANLLRLAGDYNEAELLLLDFNTHNKINARSANILSLIYGEVKKTEDELHYAKMAAELGADNAIFLGNYGCVLQKTGSIEEGIAKMREALSIDENLEYLYERLGNIARSQGDEQSALKEYKKGIEILDKRSRMNGSDLEDMTNLRRLYKKIGDYGEEKEILARISNLKKYERFQGNHKHVIAGPDSGFLSSNDVL